jgi:hypothetical protein
VNNDPGSWKEVQSEVAPGPIWAFTRGYRVRDAGRHENEKEYKAFLYYLNCGKHRDIPSTAVYIEVSAGTVNQWAKRFGWERRVASYDRREMELVFKQSQKIERARQRQAIDDFRQANEDQARNMMDVSSDIVRIIQKRLEKAEDEDEAIPMGLVSGLLRAASNISDSGRQAWATSLGVGQLMEVVDNELEEVAVEIIDGEEVDEAYEIPLDED